jgi:hypothetical protein
VSKATKRSLILRNNDNSVTEKESLKCLFLLSRNKIKTTLLSILDGNL